MVCSFKSLLCYLLLREKLHVDTADLDSATWSNTINELVEKGTIGLGPYTLELGYDFWTYCRLPPPAAIELLCRVSY